MVRPRRPHRQPHRRVLPVHVPEPVVYISSGLPKRKYDGFFPVVTSEIATRNRKRLRVIHDRFMRRTADALFVSPLVKGWVGFTAEEVEILKVGFADRSYYGGPDYRCPRCKACFWFQERVESESSIKGRRIVYNLCCKAGKVYVEPFKRPPPFLADLINFDGPPRSKEFIDKIRQYNCLFAFTSMGANIDRSVNDGGGPNIFKISGALCHRMGSLFPDKGNPPKFAELYIFRTKTEAENRMKALNRDDRTKDGLDKAIVEEFIVMLNVHNPLVKMFRMAKEVLEQNEHVELAIRIFAPGPNDGPQFNLPATDQLAGLVFGEFTVEAPCRDIIVRRKEAALQSISSLHTAYMPLQYPLLFPYADRGFQLGVRYIGVNPLNTNKRMKVTMQDFYSFCSHYKPEQHNSYL